MQSIQVINEERVVVPTEVTTKAVNIDRHQATEALKRLIESTSKNLDGTKQLQSNLMLRIAEGDEQKVQSEDFDDEMSSPTVSLGTFSEDDNLSLSSGDDDPHPIVATCDTDELLSISSMSTKRVNHITSLQNKLHVSEMTKLELLNQCADLYSHLARSNENSAETKSLKQENIKLREGSASMERDFMNEVNALAATITLKEQQHAKEMRMKEQQHTKEMRMKDQRIAELEKKLNALRMEKKTRPSKFENMSGWKHRTRR